MTVRELRDVIFQITKGYFENAKVIWSNTNVVKPKLPLVTLMMGVVQRPHQPENRFENGVPVSIYPSTVMVTVNVFTEGTNPTGYYQENTAESDLLDFLNYIDSVCGIEISNAHDIYIRHDNGVQDLSTLTNDAFWEYRARTELRVGFTQKVYGKAGLIPETGDWKQTSSGGGTEDLADAETGYFVDAEVSENIPNEEDEE